MATPDSTTKVCSKCGTEYPATRGFFSPHTSHKDGLQSRCKSCCRELYRQRSKTTPERFRYEKWQNEITFGVKKCITCDREYPATIEFFGVGNHTKDGLDSRCRNCRRNRIRQRNNTTPENFQYERRQKTKTGMKICPKCEREFPATTKYFHADKRKNDNLRSCCKDCNRAETRLYYKKHLTERRAASRLYNQGNPEKKRIYRQANLDKRAAYEQKRRARKNDVPGEYTSTDIAAQLKRQKGRCYYAACGHCKLSNAYHVEHVVPLTRKGSRNDISNIVLACPKCNQSKSDKLPHEWSEGGRLL